MIFYKEHLDNLIKEGKIKENGMPFSPNQSPNLDTNGTGVTNLGQMMDRIELNNADEGLQQINSSAIANDQMQE